MLQRLRHVPGGIHLERGTIDNLQVFAPTTQRLLQTTGLLIESGKHSLPFKDKHIRQRRQLLVKIIQQTWVLLVIPYPFEQSRTLRNNLPVLHQCLAIAWLYLAQGAVKKTPAFFWRAVNQVQIRRRKQNHLHLPNQVNHFFRDSIDLDPLTWCIGRERNRAEWRLNPFLDRRRGIKDNHFKLDIILAPFDGSLQMGNMVRSGPVHYIAIRACMKGTTRSQHPNSFKQVRLTLRILSIKKKEPRSQGKLKVPIIAKFIQREERKVHSKSQVIRESFPIVNFICQIAPSPGRRQPQYLPPHPNEIVHSRGDPWVALRPVPLPLRAYPPWATLPSASPGCGCVPTPLRTSPAPTSACPPWATQASPLHCAPLPPLRKRQSTP